MFALQARDVQRMHDYKQALARFNEIKPNRIGDRPLSRNTSLTIVKYTKDSALWAEGSYYHAKTDDMEGAIGCWYRGNECVLYRPDGVIKLSSRGWTTPSTAQFIYACTGRRAFTNRNNMYVYADYQGESGYFVLGDLEIKDGEVLNPVQQQRKVIDKAKAKEVRKELKPFVDYIMPIASAITPSTELRRSFMENGAIRNLSHYEYLDLAAHIRRGGDGWEVAYNTVMYYAMVKRTVVSATSPRTYEQQWADIRTEVQKIMRNMYKSVYMNREAWLWEDVPLGTLPGRDTI